MSSAPPPGWHPDPADPGASQRWWDGTQWTEHTRAGQAAPAAPSWPAASSSQPPSWPPVGGANGYQPPSGGYGYPGAGGAPNGGPPYGGPAYGGPAYGGSPYGGGAPVQQASFARRNQSSLVAIGVSVLYVLVALSSRIVFFGIVPILTSIRAFRAREALAPVALVAAIVSVVVAIAALSGH